jgi:cyanate permease
MLALLWLLYASLGLVMGSMAPLVTPIVNDLNISYSQMGLVLGSWQLVFIVASIGAGNLLDRWCERKSLLAGILLIGLSACLRYFSNGFGTLFSIVALIGLGGPMISAGEPKTISLWFEGKSRGMALGIYMTGSSVGVLLGFALTNSVVMPLVDYSWRTTFLIYGILAFATGLLWWFLSRDVKSATPTKRMGIFKALNQIARIRNVQLVLILGLLSLASFHGVMNWLPRILETGGMSPTLAGFAASAYIIAGMPAVMVFPHVIPLHFRGRSLALFALCVAIALYGVIGTSGVLQFIALVILGGAGFVFVPIPLLVLMDSSRIPSEYLGSANGIFLCIAQFGGFLALLVMGVLFDITEGFLVGMLLLAALNLVIMPVTFRFRIQSSSPSHAYSE